MIKKKLVCDDKLSGRIRCFNLMLDRLRREGTKYNKDELVEVWARIGMILELTEEEYEYSLESQYGDGELMRRLEIEGRIRREGESYAAQQTEVNGKEIEVELTYDENNWTLKGRD